jgi:hypothetical protein
VFLCRIKTWIYRVKALTEAGCNKVFNDKIGGSHVERPGLAMALAMLREGDTLVVWKLDPFWAGASRTLSNWSVNFMGRVFSSEASPILSTRAQPLAGLSSM